MRIKVFQFGCLTFSQLNQVNSHYIVLPFIMLDFSYPKKILCFRAAAFLWRFWTIICLHSTKESSKENSQSIFWFYLFTFGLNDLLLLILLSYSFTHRNWCITNIKILGKFISYSRFFCITLEGFWGWIAYSFYTYSKAGKKTRRKRHTFLWDYLNQ